MKMKKRIVKGLGVLILATILLQIAGISAVANDAVTLNAPDRAPRTGFYAYVYYTLFKDGRYYYGVIQQKYGSSWVTITDFYMFEPLISVFVPGSSPGYHSYRAIVYDNGATYSNTELVYLY